MYYYTIDIPRHSDGKIATYSPRWAGVMSHCPKNVTVKIFNDKEGWLLAQVDDSFVPKEVTVISEANALDLMSRTQQDIDVFVGEAKIVDRWAALEAARLQEIADEEARLKAIADANYSSAIEAVLNGW